MRLLKSFAIRSFPFLLLLIIHSLATSCQNGEKDSCSNKDATNFNPSGESEENCIFPSDQIIGAYSFEVIEYPLQSSEEGNIHVIDIRSGWDCSSDNSNKVVRIFTLQSPFDPREFCLPLDGYKFEITKQMRISWYGADLSGQGLFDAEGDFNFSGTIHRQDGSEYPIVLKGSK